MLLSGKHLKLDSPNFQKMFDGPYTEGNADPWGIRHITANDWGLTSILWSCFYRPSLSAQGRRLM